MEQILEKLFESAPKVKIMRLLVRNQDQEFSFEDVLKKSRIHSRQARSELRKLLAVGFAKERRGTIKLSKKARSGKVIIKAKKTNFFSADKNFRLLPELHNLIAKDSIASRKKLLSNIKGIGNIKLAILSGIFLNSERSRTDLTLVGSNIKKGKLETFLAEVESEIGRPLHYTIMDNEEFAYRVDMYDRFLRDILEYPHDKLINKLKI